MKAIKALVFFMGGLIVVGIVLVVYGVMRTKPAVPGGANTVAAAGTVPSIAPAVPMSLTTSGFYDSTLPVPEGAHLEQPMLIGDLLLIRATSPKGDSLLLVDPRSGQVVGRMAPPRP